MGEKAIPEAGGPAPNAPSLWWECDDVPRLPHTALQCNVLNVGKRSPYDLLCCHHVPQSKAHNTPHRDAAGQAALYGAPVESGEDGWGPQEVQMLLCPLHQ